jgi:hypothetical protein
VGLASCGSGGTSTIHINSSAPIWFHPKPGDGSDSGSMDFEQLFQTNSQWPQTLAKTQVFGVYAGWIIEATDADLQTMVTFLNAHNMGLEIEAPAMQALSTCGSGVEGYVPYGQTVEQVTLAYLQRLQALGAKVPYIKVDEPFFFGHVTNEQGSCNFSVTQVATEVAQYTQIVHTVYPDTQVGDVEPVITQLYVPDVVTALGQWHATYQTVSGSAFPFYIADIDWSNPQWPTLVKQLEDATRTSGLKFGIIYIGDSQDTSDAEWTGKVVERFTTYQGQSGGNPDFVLFQSWETHPVYCLPETNATTFTGALDAYVQATS